MVENLHVVIMAGGSGERFWPLSTPTYPKQFLDILGTGRTLLQSAYRRARHLTGAENIWVITSEAGVALVREQLPTLPAEQVLGEPRKCNTAPCIALASALLPEESTVVFLPSDHLIEDEASFVGSLQTGVQLAQTGEYTVTIGVVPSRAETGYGYIEVGESLPRVKEGYAVHAFKEKPSAAVAERYVAAGGYLWNSGMFIWHNAHLRALLGLHLPELWACMQPVVQSESVDLASLYAEITPISIDYGLLEKCERIAVVKGNFGWSDLGTYSSVGFHLPHDESGNVVVGGEARFFQSHCNIVYSAPQRRMVLVGLEGYVVAESEEGLLICPVAQEQRIKEFIAKE